MYKLIQSIRGGCRSFSTAGPTPPPRPHIKTSAAENRV